MDFRKATDDELQAELDEIDATEVRNERDEHALSVRADIIERELEQREHDREDPSSGLHGPS
jgi:hypothetical protein